MWFRLLLTAAALASLAGAADWKLVWSDEFNRKGPPDPSKWGYEKGFLRNQESQYYTEARIENARIDKGTLILEARKELFRNPEGSAQSRDWRKAETAQYTSAALTTQGKASWKHARVEVRAKLPAGRGTWPAIWMLGDNISSVDWPACGEIDIMEHVGFNPGVIHANVHMKKYNHASNSGKGDKTALPDAMDKFHVYAVEWSGQQMDFFVDGRKYFAFSNEGSGVDAWPFDQPFYLILNVAIGGSWGGEKGIDDSIFPQRMEVDWVRVYQRQ
jgi:beta-glucanase (GH16 family)